MQLLNKPFLQQQSLKDGWIEHVKIESTGCPHLKNLPAGVRKNSRATSKVLVCSGANTDSVF